MTYFRIVFNKLLTVLVTGDSEELNAETVTMQNQIKTFLFWFQFTIFLSTFSILLMKSHFCSVLSNFFNHWTFWSYNYVKQKFFSSNSLLHHFSFKTIRFIEILVHLFLSQIDNLCIWINISMLYLSNKQIHKFIFFCNTNALILKYVQFDLIVS